MKFYQMGFTLRSELTLKAILSVILPVFSLYNYEIPEVPIWPTNYKTCVTMADRDVGALTVGWYVDGNTQKMRLDSYGMPKDNRYIYMPNPDNEFQYACTQLGEPLYEFVYDYGRGFEYNIGPAPNPPYKQCSRRNITNSFPPSPILASIQFLGEDRDNLTTFFHWRAEYFLFTMDYYFHKDTGLPYKLFVDAQEQNFLSFETTKLSDSVFRPPPGVTCIPDG